VAEERIVVDLSARERRLYERIRAKWVECAPGRSSGFADIALVVPDLMVLLVRLLRDSRVPLGVKALVLGGVGYVLSPIDLLPEIVFGPIGFLDDALVMAAALSRLVNSVHPDVVRAHWPGQGDALEAIQHVTDWAENVVTRRMPAVLQRWFGLGR
jgi:uncharacterized membrane protein YkvA (DUF1232 family)